MTITTLDVIMPSYHLWRMGVRPVILYYLDESEGATHYVRSAIGIKVEVWNEAFYGVQDWRKEVMRLYHIPLFKELHASDLLAGRGMLVREGRKYKRVKREDAAKIFVSGLQRLENLAISLSGGLEIINTSLPKASFGKTDIETLIRILNRINTSANRQGRRAFLIFDEGKEKQVARWYRRMRIYNPVPSKYGQWGTGEEWKNIPIQNIISGPAFRSSAGDYFLQLVDFVAHALLKQDEKPPIARITQYHLDKAFNILDTALNKLASGDDPKGVVRH